MTEGKPPLTVQLVWEGDRRFAATSGSVSMTLDGDSAAGPSPMQAVACGLAACMGIDVVDILTRGRHPIVALEATLTADRAQTTPARFTRFALHYVVRGAVPEAAVLRAIELSREKYCSVWHSLRQDVELSVTHAIQS